MDPEELEIATNAVTNVHTAASLSNATKYTIQNIGDYTVKIGGFAVEPTVATMKGLILEQGHFATITAAAARPLYALAQAGTTTIAVVPA